MESQYAILAINPGSTSTKIAVFKDNIPEHEFVIRHNTDDLSGFHTIIDQREYRAKLIQDTLLAVNVDMGALDAVVGRGGLIDPLVSGTYEINAEMLKDLQSTAKAQHASSLGGIIAHEIGEKYNIQAFVVDPVVVDEMDPRAKLSGYPGFERVSKFHALNQKAVARRCAKDMGKDYEDCRFVVAHMGGGITIGAHKYGCVIDVNNGLDGDGPFSPERTGGLPLEPVVRMCYSGKYSEKDMLDLVVRNGGLKAYLGTNDAMKVERMIMAGDSHALVVFQSMAYQIAKDIGAMSVTLEGRVDAIILTGGLAFSKRLCSFIKNDTGWIAPIKVYPGEDELLALAEGALRVLKGEERAMKYADTIAARDQKAL